MDNFSFHLLFEFKFNNNIVFNKKQKIDGSISGSNLKSLAQEILTQFDKNITYEISRILVSDKDFQDERIDIDNNDIFILNEKVFVELLLKPLLNESINPAQFNLLISNTSSMFTSSPVALNSPIQTSVPLALSNISNESQSAEAHEIVTLINNNKKTRDIPPISNNQFILWRQRVIRAVGTLLMTK